MTEPSPNDAQAAAPRRPRRPVRLGLLVLLVLAVPVVLGLAAVWATSGRLLPVPAFVTERVLERVNASLPIGEQLAVDAVSVGVASDFETVEIVATQARLNRADSADPLRVPQVLVSLDAGALLERRALVRRVLVTDAWVRVRRDAQGRFDLALGDGAGAALALPQSWADGLSALDATLETPGIAGLREVVARNTRLVFVDEPTGRRIVLREGEVSLNKTPDGFDLDLSALVAGGRVALDVARTRGRGARLRLDLEALNSEDLWAVLGLSGVPVASAVLEARLGMAVSEAGVLQPWEVDLIALDGAVTGWQGATFDRARVALRVDPSAKRVEVVEAALASQQVAVQSAGQLLLGAGLADPVLVQLQMSEMVLDPTGVLQNPALFDGGLLEGRLSLVPFRFEIGQAMIAAGDDAVRTRGQIWSAPDGGLGAALAVSADRVQADRLKTLWPERLIPKTREWFMANLTGGVVTEFAAALRKAEDERVPEITGSFGFEGAEVRFLKHLPVARNAQGVGNFHRSRLALRIDSAVVSAEGVGDVALDGTTFTLPDTLARPVVAELELAVEGEIPAVLSVLDNKPFEVLTRADRGLDLATGRARVTGPLQVPLQPVVLPDDVVFDLTGVLTDVRSDKLVPNRVVTARALEISVRPEAVEISGAGRLDAVPVQVVWRQPLPQEVGVPAAPATLEGSLNVSDESLRALGVTFERGMISGAARAGFSTTLRKGEVPTLRVTSNLGGLGLSLPQLGYSKTRRSTGQLALDVVLSQPARVSALSLSAPGLDVEGQVRLRSSGGLDVANLSRVRLGGWLDAAVTLTGRGAGRAPRVAVTGGRVDLRRASFGSGGGAGGPIEVRLDRLTVAEGISLTGLSATLTQSGGTSGQFRGRVNGGARVSGTMVPSPTGMAVRLRAEDAGAVMRAANLFQNGLGGEMDLRLVPLTGTGRYSGRLEIENMRVKDAPVLASILSAVSVVGIVEQLAGEGLFFGTVEADFEILPDQIKVLRSAALGPSMGLSADGTYDTAARALDIQGVVSPFYLVNGVLGGLLALRKEGLIGMNYRLTGAAAAPRVRVNPLSILTPGVFREIFRRPAPRASE